MTLTNSPSLRDGRGPRRRILVEVAEGRSAGAILENGFIQLCLSEGVDVDILAPGAKYPPFVERYSREGVRFFYLPIGKYGLADRRVAMEGRVGEWLLRKGRPGARRFLWRLVGERLAAGMAGDLAGLLRHDPPDAFVSTTTTDGFDLGLIAVARRMGIPTLGNIFSWDHPFRAQASRPDHLTCWSEFVKGELVRRQGYRPDQVEVVGAPAFDPYVREDCTWSKERLCSTLGLDPARPILVFASLGQLRMFLDETGSFRALMAAIDGGRVQGNPQIVLRLHPMSRDYFFQGCCGGRNLVVSRFVGYCPGMRWWPSFDEVVLAANILRHADVCVSPGSTVTIETAIFNVPTIIPAFNPFCEEEYRAYFQEFWLDSHFRFIVDEKLLPMAETIDQLVDAVNRALVDRGWTAKGQERIREKILGPLDGGSTGRLAQAAIKMARGAGTPNRRHQD